MAIQQNSYDAQSTDFITHTSQWPKDYVKFWKANSNRDTN